MRDLAAAIDALASEIAFSGVVRIERNGQIELDRAFGHADRAHDVPNTIDTRFGIASVAKGFTALVIMRLIDDGALALETTARSLLGSDLPVIDGRVTIEHLLSHRSGIGDYLDEADHDIDDYVMPVPVHRLVDTVDYLPVLDGHPAKFEPGARFSYCNGGYVVLALLAERAAGAPFAELVDRVVCRPAGMERTGFDRSDELAGDTARGYLAADGRRTNVLHLPVRGTGDGGLYSTVADLHRLWAALRAGRIVGVDVVAAMTTPHSRDVQPGLGYGLGFWLRPALGAWSLEGYDAGVSVRSIVRDGGDLVHSVIANTSEGAWPVTKLIEERLGT